MDREMLAQVAQLAGLGVVASWPETGVWLLTSQWQREPPSFVP